MCWQVTFKKKYGRVTTDLNSSCAIRKKAMVEILDSKTAWLLSGAVLIFIALVLGGMQLLEVYNFAQFVGRRLYFYGIVGIIGLFGIILAFWGLMKKETAAKPTQ